MMLHIWLTHSVSASGEPKVMGRHIDKCINGTSFTNQTFLYRQKGTKLCRGYKFPRQTIKSGTEMKFTSGDERH